MTSANQPTPQTPAPSNTPKSVSFWRVLAGVFFALCVVCVMLLYVAMGTEAGSRFLVEEVVARAQGNAKIAMTYDKGTLRDGVWLSDVSIAPDDKVRITIDKAQISLGLRSLIARQVHVSSAEVGTVRILDSNPPTGAPFSYTKLSTPITLVLEDTRIKRLSYENVGSQPVTFDEISIARASWHNETVTLKEGTVTIAEEVVVSGANGSISFVGDYPVEVKAGVEVLSLKDKYVPVFDVDAKGTLKHTFGTVVGSYNNHKVTGNFTVQSLREGAPFSASLSAPTLVLPYAPEQQLSFNDLRVDVDGVWSDMTLRIQSALDGKDVPKGQYSARARLRPTTGMDIQRMVAITDDGELKATGKLDWQKAFVLTSTITSDNFALPSAMPDEYQQYAEYLPDTLDGSLDFNLWENDAGNRRYVFALAQKDGERVQADISHPIDKKNPPYTINTSWQALRRKDLSQLGALDSPSGQATIIVDNDVVRIDGRADIDSLLELPKGAYQATGRIEAGVIYVEKSAYQGEMGDLSADGKVYLAQQNKPLSYELALATKRLSLSKLLQDDSLPIDDLSGTLQVLGSYHDEAQGVRHEWTFKDSALSAIVNNNKAKTISLAGKGKASVQLSAKDIRHLALDFDGKLATTAIADGLKDNALSVSVAGDLSKLEFSKLTLSGSAGHLSAGGKVRFDDGIGWQMAVRTDRLDVGRFYDQTAMMVTGDLTTTGRYKDARLVHSEATFAGDVLSRDTRVPSGRLALEAVGSGEKFTINRMTYQGVAGELVASGYVDMAKGMVGATDARLTNFDIGQFVKGYPSRLSGTLNVWVDWQKSHQALELKNLDLSGVVRDVPVALSGEVSARLDLPSDVRAYFARLQKPRFSLDRVLKSRADNLYGNLTLLGQQAGELQETLAKQDKALRRLIERLYAKDLVLVWGDNRLGVDGDERRLGIEIEANDLTQIAKSVRGEVSGSLILVGDDNSLPTIYSDLRVNNVSMPSFAVRNGSVLGRVVNLANADSALVVQGVGVVAFGRSFRQARLDVKGTQAHHNLVSFINDGNLQMHARLQGGYDGAHYTGVLSEGRLQTHDGVLNQLQPAELDYEVATGALLVAGHCWQTLSPKGTARVDNGALCLKEKLAFSKDKGRINLGIQNVDMAVFTPLLPDDLSVRARLNGTVDATWGGHAPKINAVLYSDNGELGLRTEGLPDTTMGYERVSLIAQSVPQGLKLRTDIKAGQAGNGFVDIIIDPYKKDKPIAGELVLNELNLAMFRPFFPAMRVLAGEMNVAGNVGGTLAHPTFHGNANLADGRLALADAPISLSEIYWTANIQGTSATLDGRFVAGQGKGVLTGEMDWKNDIQAKATIKGEALTLSRPPLLSAEVSPHLQVLFRPRQKYVDIKGVISVPTATIRPPEETGKFVAKSDNVTIIDRRASTNVNRLLQKVVPWSINADIGLDLGDEVVFSGFGAKLPLAGALHLTQSGQGTMQGRGVVQVSERTAVDFLGQNLELNYAQIRFNGGLTNPRLSIEGVRKIDGQTVGVRVSGTAQNPDIQVFNDAGLTKEQAMNALATGNLAEAGVNQISEQGFRSQVTNSLAAAGLSFGLQGTRGVTNEIGRALGLDSLVVDASGNASDANVNITGYISPDLYVRYGVGVFNAETSLSMRYQLTRRIYVEARSATERIVDVVYRWRFK